MPTIILRGLTSDLVTRIRTYADARRLSQRDAVEQLLRDHLDALEARARGGLARHAGTSRAERSEAARRAANARWAHRDG